MLEGLVGLFEGLEGLESSGMDTSFGPIFLLYCTRLRHMTCTLHPVGNITIPRVFQINKNDFELHHVNRFPL